MTAIQIGRLLRANTTGFVVGCAVAEADKPTFGGLVRAPAGDGHQIYGLIYDIHIDDDGIVRQLATTSSVDEAVIADNRVNRNVPLEVSVLTLGFKDQSGIHHLLPPHPPLSLDMIHLCDDEEVRDFTSHGRFGYFRHLLRAKDLPVAELMAVHLKNTQQVHSEIGIKGWATNATRELIVLLRDDYSVLMNVLSALEDGLHKYWLERGKYE